MYSYVKCPIDGHGYDCLCDLRQCKECREFRPAEYVKDELCVPCDLVRKWHYEQYRLRYEAFARYCVNFWQ